MFRFLIIIIIFFFSSNLLSKEIKIISIIDNQTITNVDILKEMNYLIALNSSYKNIEQDKMLDIARDSLINEIIKKIELKKYFKLGEKNQSIEAEINKIFNQINLNNDDKIKSYLDNFNINYDYVYRKIEIELKWNQLIYELYKDKVITDDKEIEIEIKNKFNNSTEFNLSEIIFTAENLNELKNKYLEIIDTINLNGFDQAVLIHSSAKSKENFGKIGWINENNLSKKILEELNKIEVGKVTEPIPFSNGALIILLNDKRLVSFDQNKINDEIVKIKSQKINTQLSKYSSLYFNKIKNNILVE